MKKRIIKPHILHGKITAVACAKQLQQSLLLAALAEGETIIKNVAPPLDAETTMLIQALADNGFCSIEEISGGYKVSAKNNTNQQLQVQCGESERLLYLLLPTLTQCSAGGCFFLPPQLLSRLNMDYLQMLEQHGLHYQLQENCLQIEGRLRPGDYLLQVDYPSAIASGLLLSLPLLTSSANLSFAGSAATRVAMEMSMAVARKFGAYYYVEKDNIEIEPINCYYGGELVIEGDYTYAAAFLAAALTGDILIDNLPQRTLQSEALILHILSKMGAEIDRQDDMLEVKNCELRAIDFDVSGSPDLLPVLAILCSRATGISHLHGIASCNKQTVQLLLENLGMLGADIALSADKQQLSIRGKTTLQGGALNAGNEPELAMALSIAALMATGKSSLMDEGAVPAKFWQDMKLLQISAPGRLLQCIKEKMKTKL